MRFRNHYHKGRARGAAQLLVGITGFFIVAIASAVLASLIAHAAPSAGTAPSIATPVTSAPNSSAAPGSSAPTTACVHPDLCFASPQIQADWAAQHHCTFCAITLAEVRSIFVDAPISTLQSIVNALNGHLVAYGLDNYTRLTQFFAQADIETGGGRHFMENLNYSAQGLIATFPSYFKKHPEDACEYGRIDPSSSKKGDKQSVAFCKALAKKEMKKKGGYVYKAHAADQEPIANRAYSKKNKNGDVASGDGWKYRGRGMFMVTEKGNYESFQNWYNLEASPKSQQDFLKNPGLLEEPRYAVTSAAWFWLQNGLATTADDMRNGTSACAVANKITKVVDKHTNTYTKRCKLATQIAKAGTFNTVDCTLPPADGKPVDF